MRKGIPSPTAANMATTLCDWWNRLTKFKRGLRVRNCSRSSQLTLNTVYYSTVSQVQSTHVLVPLECCRQFPSPGYVYVLLLSSGWNNTPSTQILLNCLSLGKEKRGSIIIIIQMLHKVLHIQNSEPRGFETCSIVLTFSSHHPPPFPT